MSGYSFSYQAVQPKQGTPGVVAPEGGAGSSAPPGPPPGNTLVMLLPLLMVLPLFFMSFRRQKKETEARKALKKGDRVLTNGGMVGELVEMDERLAKVKVAPGVILTVVTTTVSPFDSAPVELKDAKVALDKK